MTVDVDEECVAWVLIVTTEAIYEVVVALLLLGVPLLVFCLKYFCLCLAAVTFERFLDLPFISELIADVLVGLTQLCVG